MNRFDNYLNYGVDLRIKQQKSLFSFLSKEKKPLQLYRDKLGTVLVTDKVMIIDEDKIEESESIKDVSFEGSFKELMIQAKNDVNLLNKTLNKFAERNLSIEVKIRAENLLLNNITFLEGIKSGIDAINLEDTYFLKNNLGKYLIQCIDVYGKSVTRYETLLDPNNKKIFSKQSEEDIEKYKEKIDSEALKQLQLLEKELDLVKEHIVNQFNSDLLRDMRINTRILESRIENKSELVSEINNIIKIQKNN